MSIYKKKSKGKIKSKFYWTKFTFQGQLIQRSTRCTNRSDARDFEADLRSQLNRGRIGIEESKLKRVQITTVKDGVDEFLAWSKVNQRESTYKRYLTSSQPVMEYFGRHDVTKLTKQDVERFMHHRAASKKKAPARKLKANPKAKTKKPIAPATVNRDLAFLSVVLSRLLELGKITRNPVSRVKHLKENNLQLRVVSPGEFKKYVMAASQPLRDVAVMMYETGMRPDEVLKLRKIDVDFNLDKIRIPDGKTAAARRQLTMSPNTKKILLSRSKSAKGEYLFAGGKAGQSKLSASGEAPVTKVNNAHNGAVKRSGVSPFSLYALRHTFATEFVASGGDLVTLAAILGHSSLRMVMRYAHPTQGHQADAMARLQRFRKKAA